MTPACRKNDGPIRRVAGLRAYPTSAVMARRIGSGRVGQASMMRARRGSVSVGLVKARSGRSLVLPEVVPGADLRSAPKRLWLSLSRFESWPGSLTYDE